MDKEKYLKPVIEDEEILIEDICLSSSTDRGIGLSDNEEEFSNV